jgi:hypothetical protein
LSNDRCDQENLIAQLKSGVRVLTTNVDDLVSNWAYMVMGSLAWSLKAWSALLVPVAPRHRARHQAERRTLLRMEFATYREAFLRMTCLLARTGRRLIYRFLSWNPWHGRSSVWSSGCTHAGCVDRSVTEVGVRMPRSLGATERRKGVEGGSEQFGLARQAPNPRAGEGTS